ncbi:unnamed protein product [Amoebophrya sp. A25]|nr:unnamed protein product [Amoebophrya sp. A25]|eukprot:GSA25T00016310001.1
MIQLVRIHHLQMEVVVLPKMEVGGKKQVVVVVAGNIVSQGRTPRKTSTSILCRK